MKYDNNGDPTDLEAAFRWLEKAGYGYALDPIKTYIEKLEVQNELNVDDKHKVSLFALRLIALSYREYIDRCNISPCEFANQILDYLDEDFTIPSDYEHINKLMHDFWKWRRETKQEGPDLSVVTLPGKRTSTTTNASQSFFVV